MASENMFKNISKMILIICTLFPAISTADSFFVERAFDADSGFSGINRSLYELTKNEVASLGHVVVPNQDLSQWTLRASLLKLNETYILTMARLQNGKTLFSNKLKIDSLDNMDRGVEILVKSVLKNKKVKSLEAVDVRNRQEVTRDCYVALGPGYLSGLNADSTGVAWAMGYLWGLDPQFSLRLNLEGLNVSDSGADVFMLAFGGQYYLNNSRQSPYLLGLAGYSWIDSEDAGACTSCTGNSERGWGMEAGLGMHFYRNAAVNLAVELTHAKPFYNVDGKSSGATSLKLVVLW